MQTDVTQVLVAVLLATAATIGVGLGGLETWIALRYSQGVLLPSGRRARGMLTGAFIWGFLGFCFLAALVAHLRSLP